MTTNNAITILATLQSHMEQCESLATQLLAKLPAAVDIPELSWVKSLASPNGKASDLCPKLRIALEHINRKLHESLAPKKAAEQPKPSAKSAPKVDNKAVNAAADKLCRELAQAAKAAGKNVDALVEAQAASMGIKLPADAPRIDWARAIVTATMNGQKAAAEQPKPAAKPAPAPITPKDTVDPVRPVEQPKVAAQDKPAVVESGTAALPPKTPSKKATTRVELLAQLASLGVSSSDTLTTGNGDKVVAAQAHPLTLKAELTRRQKTVAAQNAPSLPPATQFNRGQLVTMIAEQAAKLGLTDKKADLETLRAVAQKMGLVA